MVSGGAVDTGMMGFKHWLIFLESGRFDLDGFNALFRRQLAALLPRVTDTSRRVSLEAMRDFDFVGYILAALRNAGFRDPQEREQAAHDLVVQLLVSPGQLFADYNASSGSLEARFKLSVQNGIRNLLRGQRRRQRSSRAIGIGPAVGEVPAEAIPDRHNDDDEVQAAFRDFLRREVGEDAVRLLDRRLDGISLRQLAGHQGFGSGWALRRLMRQVREAALAFARQQGDDEFLTAIERLTDG